MKKNYKRKGNTTKKVIFNAHKGVIKSLQKNAKKLNQSQNHYLINSLKSFLDFSARDNLFFYGDLESVKENENSNMEVTKC